MILATKTGWLIALRQCRETEKSWYVRDFDSAREYRVSKTGKNRQVFSCTDDAIKWMDGEEE